MDFISLIRFVATLLITNSHFGDLYPSGYSHLATGGMIGSALFFFCSGYSLYISFNKTKLSGFQWLLKRFLRIYPSMWIFRALSWLFLREDFSWINIIIPGYLFLNVIITFYLVFYFIIRYCSKYLITIMVLLTIPFVTAFFLQSDRYPHFIMEDTSNCFYLHYFYLFAIMLSGAILAKRKNEINSNKYDLLKLFASIGLYYGYKGILIYHELWIFQLFLPLFLIIVMYFFFRASNYIIRINFFRHKKFQSFIFYISNLTLDIYIVQSVCINYAKNYSFPIGYLGAIMLIALLAIILNYLTKQIVKFAYKKL